jgi:NADPH:quinone reductase-like Zn-dependent oxidoreductase
VNHSIFDYKRALRPNGIFVAVGGSGGVLFQFIVLAPLLARSWRKKMGILAWKPNKKEDLLFLKELFEAGKVKPAIDRCYPLNNAAEALRYIEEGEALGKVVLSVTNDNS